MFTNPSPSSPKSNQLLCTSQLFSKINAQVGVLAETLYRKWRNLVAEHTVSSPTSSPSEKASSSAPLPIGETSSPPTPPPMDTLNRTVESFAENQVARDRASYFARYSRGGVSIFLFLQENLSVQVTGPDQSMVSVNYASSSSGHCSSADVSLSHSGAYATMLDRLQVTFLFALLLSHHCECY